MDNVHLRIVFSYDILTSLGPCANAQCPVAQSYFNTDFRSLSSLKQVGNAHVLYFSRDTHIA